MANDEVVVGQLAEVWGSVVTACEGLTPEQWSLPTDCPGWSVRDQISHLISIERSLLGDPVPPKLAVAPPYVKNPIGEMNEPWIEQRRSTPGDEVLAEFEETAARRLEALRSFPTEQFEVVGWSPIGDVPYRTFMTVRVFDSWAHEQDIRIALDRPGGRGGAGEAITLDRCFLTVGYTVGKKVAPPDGTTVVFTVTGPLGRQEAVRVQGGRAVTVDGAQPHPTVELTMEQVAFWRLGLGRCTGSEALAAGDVVVAGDLDLGRRIVEAMPFMI
ncbi:MAG TPA: maleylpyruvate isomerase N-terminal domain-containing protein [Acidimicrobiales bacterium]|nr:maleylpyruvate isomerase N-terminal domain-containing protein [Acidimicrobiales bacterium]